MAEQTDGERYILFLGTITVKNDRATFSLLRLVFGYSGYVNVKRSRFCLHGNQGSFTCIHVSSRLSPKRSNVNCSVPGKSLQTAHITAVKRLTTRIAKMELSYFLHENGI